GLLGLKWIMSRCIVALAASYRGNGEQRTAHRVPVEVVRFALVTFGALGVADIRNVGVNVLEGARIGQTRVNHVVGSRRFQCPTGGGSGQVASRPHHGSPDYQQQEQAGGKQANSGPSSRQIGDFPWRWTWGLACVAVHTSCPCRLCCRPEGLHPSPWSS